MNPKVLLWLSQEVMVSALKAQGISKPILKAISLYLLGAYRLHCTFEEN
ncbi:hypothetical protein [Acaryochloris phage A-HIS2]|nr:hypothetical protein [Acaryochloris phage A-HIS2]